MEKIIKYKLLMATLEHVHNEETDQEERQATWKEYKVHSMKLDPDMGRIVSVTIVDTDGEELGVAIDNVSTFVQEATSMFDKDGSEIYGGHIVTLPLIFDNAEEAKQMMLPVVWINGAWCLVVPEVDNPIYLDQKNTRSMKIVGTVYQNGELAERKIDDVVREQMENAEDTEVPL